MNMGEMAVNPGAIDALNEHLTSLGETSVVTNIANDVSMSGDLRQVGKMVIGSLYISDKGSSSVSFGVTKKPPVNMYFPIFKPENSSIVGYGLIRANGNATMSANGYVTIVYNAD